MMEPVVPTTELAQTMRDDGRAVEEFAAQASIGHLCALVDELRPDAERWRALRGIPYERLGNAGVPCVALPDSHNSGDYLTGEDADEAVDEFMARQKSGIDGIPDQHGATGQS